MDFSKLAHNRLTPDFDIKPFDCGDSDLNEFLLKDSKNYLSHLLAVTYIIEDENNTLAFYSLLNDKIMVEDLSDKSAWNRFTKRFNNRKRHKSYPAMKIGRFGVNNKIQGQGCGKALLDYLKILFISNNRTGCRFITVDAYNESLNFYEKNGFDYLTEKDKGKDTRLMYFDLRTLTE